MPDKSITCAPAGIARLGPTSRMRVPSTMITWLVRMRAVSGSSSRPARITVTGAWAPSELPNNTAARMTSAVRRRTHLFITASEAVIIEGNYLIAGLERRRRQRWHAQPPRLHDAHRPLMSRFRRVGKPLEPDRQDVAI